VYVCDSHRGKVSLGKAVLGAGAIAAFRTGMDQAAPGLREKIYDTAVMLKGLYDHVTDSMNKDRRPAE
jgi:hypothetical protein